MHMRLVLMVLLIAFAAEVKADGGNLEHCFWCFQSFQLGQVMQTPGMVRLGQHLKVRAFLFLNRVTSSPRPCDIKGDEGICENSKVKFLMRNPYLSRVTDLAVLKVKGNRSGLLFAQAA